MLEEGKSYSGYERNSAFLNLGGKTPRFADISGACGLDLMDDGRSIAVCDWDFDGRQDFWISNRTAPRLRFQHNRSRTPHSFVAFKLQSPKGNRHAVGARVELTLKSDPARKLIRTVRAGEGFLAQSSSWLHLGIPEGGEIESVSVRWSGGRSEKISGVQVGKFHLITQGAGSAKVWNPSQKIDLIKLPYPDPREKISEAARVVMASPLPLPAATYLDLNGRRQTIAPAGKPLLLNLWATWCAPCEVEMAAWTKEERKLRALGLDLLALSVDDPTDAYADRIKLVRPFLTQRKFPFRAGLADAGFLDVLEVAGRAQLDKYETLPVPSSLLLDSKGRIAVLYKGPVEAEQLAHDLALLKRPPEQRHAEAAHFPGRWIDGPWAPDPTSMIDKFMSFGDPESARKYLDLFTKSVAEARHQDLSEAYFLVGSELSIQRNDREALTALSRAITINPTKIRARLKLATILFRNRQFTHAIPHLRTVIKEHSLDHNTRKMLSLALTQTGDFANAARHLKYLSSLDPKDAMAKLWYAHALIRTGQPAKADRLLRSALQQQPTSHLILNELAWLLATHPQEQFRNPREALSLALRATKITKGGNPQILDTLAAAQAAGGNYKDAVTTLEHALAILKKSGGAGMKPLQERAILYSKSEPFRANFPKDE